MLEGRALTCDLLGEHQLGEPPPGEGTLGPLVERVDILEQDLPLLHVVFVLHTRWVRAAHS